MYDSQGQPPTGTVFSSSTQHCSMLPSSSAPFFVSLCRRSECDRILINASSSLLISSTVYASEDEDDGAK